jgi:hypothetical protein
MRHRIASFVGMCLLGLVLAAPASASTTAVSIDLHGIFETGVETFTATGLCPSGTAGSFGFHMAGNGRATTFHLYKTLTCTGTADSITIRVEASSVFGTGGTTGGWNVVSGTGIYEGIHGGGSLIGIGFEGGIDDQYVGRLTN